jgi:YihY family inner membrane protein
VSDTPDTASADGAQRQARTVCVQRIARRPFIFLLRVLKGFKRNQGILLSGAVAYYMLLSVVPLFALLLVGLSHFYAPEALIATLTQEMHLLAPTVADALSQQMADFAHNKQLVSWVGIAVLVFFSTMAFTVLENAMSVIFFHRVAIKRRHFLVSAIIPFAFIALIGIGLLLITFVSGLLAMIDSTHIALFGQVWVIDDVAGTGVYLLGFLGLVLMLTALYLVMPVGQLAPTHALIGGLVAALLWELTRNFLVWYFSTLSLVNMVYGSFATAVVLLLSFEAAAIILLLGAQVIAEFERCGLQLDEGQDGFHTR